MKKKRLTDHLVRAGWTKLLRVMKLTAFLVLILVIDVSASLYSQNSKVSVKVINGTLSEIFNKIEEQSEYRFFYQNEQIRNVERKSIDVSNKNPLELVSDLLGSTNLTYKLVDRNIIIFPSSEKNIMESATQQQKSVSGKVTDTTGAGLPGVSVVVKGTTTGVITDMDGKYSLAKVPDNATLQFSFVGMKTQEIAVSGKTAIDIVLADETIGLEEVVAVGYGTMKKSDLTGSVTSVNSGKITQRAITSMEQGLQGRMAGVQVTQPSGAPGASAIVRVRGTNSIQYGNDPLYVVDGFPLSNGISFINPNDIETMTVLKDASATAIYGSRGANGVILVTTKKGTSGKTIVSFESYYGVQDVTKKVDLLNAKDFATAHRLFWQRYRAGALLSRAFPQDQIDKMGKGTDWQDEIFRTGAIQSHNLSLSGGNDMTTFAVSGNYLNQDGIVINSGYTKGTVSVNLEHKSNKFKFGVNTVTTYEKYRSISDGSVIYTALNMAPTSPVKNSDGSYFSQLDFYNKTGIMANTGYQNPVQAAYEQVANSNTTRMLGNFYGSYEIIEGLIAKVSIGADLLFSRSNAYTPSYFSSQTASKGTANISSRQIFGYINENTLTYIKTFNKVHSFTALAGLTTQRATTESMAAGNTNFYSDIPLYYNIGNGATPTTPSSGYNRWSLASFLGRVNYSYADKYLVTVSARYDGSSRFGENNRFGFFPSAALAWKVTQEDFLKDANWLSDLKLRTSYGRTGNQEIPLYQNVQPYNKVTSYVFGTSAATAVAPGSLVNPDLKWETTDQYDAGFDVGFLKNKLSFTADYYYKKTHDLLFGVNVPRQGGYSTVLQNIGSVENKGFEFGINVNLGKRDFHWTSSANISFNRNKVLALADANQFFGSVFDSGKVQKNGGSATVIKVGEPIGMFWGNVFEGIWQTPEEFAAGSMKNNVNVGVGYEKFKDVDGNGVFEESKDETIIGNPNPKFEFGMTNSFTYKNFDLSFFINGTYGNDVFNANLIELTSQVNINNGSTRYLQAWNGPGTSNTQPTIDRLGTRSGTFPNRVSTQYIEDGSFVRLQNVTFGYKLPVNFMKNLRVYISADNLITLTHYSWYNPQVSAMGNSSTAMGIDYGTYPLAKTVRFGIQASF